jgi:Flp pilus assembly protein TadB
MRPLYTTRIGDIVLVAGALMLVLGIFWMRKTIKIEV